MLPIIYLLIVYINIYIYIYISHSYYIDIYSISKTFKCDIHVLFPPQDYRHVFSPITILSTSSSWSRRPGPSYFILSLFHFLCHMAVVQSILAHSPFLSPMPFHVPIPIPARAQCIHVLSCTIIAQYCSIQHIYI